MFLPYFILFTLFLRCNWFCAFCVNEVLWHCICVWCFFSVVSHYINGYKVNNNVFWRELIRPDCHLRRRIDEMAQRLLSFTSSTIKYTRSILLFQSFLQYSVENLQIHYQIIQSWRLVVHKVWLNTIFIHHHTLFSR